MNHPNKRKGFFDQQAAELAKRRRTGTGTLASIARKRQQEAALFADTMTRPSNMKMVTAAKEVFNPELASKPQNDATSIFAVTPNKPDTDDPEKLHHHIDVLNGLSEDNEKVR